VVEQQPIGGPQTLIIENIDFERDENMYASTILNAMPGVLDPNWMNKVPGTLILSNRATLGVASG
jgi:hypothetical protein